MEGKRPGPRTIKRYSNRKLYDPAARRYVTLQQLAALVARGEDVVVLEQAGGADVTNLTLAQALLESVRDGASRIPRHALKQLIRITRVSDPGWGDWPEPKDAAGRARREAERLVARLLGTGRLSLDEAIALRGGVADLVHRLVTDAQEGVEARLRGLLARGEQAAERSLGALRGRLEAYAAKPVPRTAAAAPPRRSRRPAARPRPAKQARRGPRRPRPSD